MSNEVSRGCGCQLAIVQHLSPRDWQETTIERHECRYSPDDAADAEKYRKGVAAIRALAQCGGYIGDALKQALELLSAEATDAKNSC